MVAILLLLDFIILLTWQIVDPIASHVQNLTLQVRTSERKRNEEKGKKTRKGNGFDRLTFLQILVYALKRLELSPTIHANCFMLHTEVRECWDQWNLNP